MPRDSQRSKLYHAEEEVPKGQRFSNIGEVRSYVDHVIGSRWWRNRSSIISVTVKDGRGRRRAGAWTIGTLGFVAMPRWSRCELYTLHELAHVITPRRFAWHGREFARNFLALVGRWMGKQAASDLRQSFRQYRVKWYQRTALAEALGQEAE